jgi:hypothetical protein
MRAIDGFERSHPMDPHMVTVHRADSEVCLCCASSQVSQVRLVACMALLSPAVPSMGLSNVDTDGLIGCRHSIWDVVERCQGSRSMPESPISTGRGWVPGRGGG